MGLERKIPADGLSEDALTQIVEHQVKDFVRNPRIMVSPLYSVTVFGAVAQPGRYYINETDDVVNVLGMAGGTTSMASDKLSLLRAGRKQCYSLKEILVTGKTPRVRLQSGDILFVGEKWVTLRDVYSLIVTLSSALTLVVLLDTLAK